MANRPLRDETMTEDFGLRLMDVHKLKLDRLARETRRSRAEVVRWLIEQAELTGNPDITTAQAQQSGG